MDINLTETGNNGEVSLYIKGERRLTGRPLISDP